MQAQRLELLASSPGLSHSLRVLRFGTPGIGPKAYIQAARPLPKPLWSLTFGLRTQLRALCGFKELFSKCP